jgi:hypothetical protein
MQFRTFDPPKNMDYSRIVHRGGEHIFQLWDSSEQVLRECELGERYSHETNPHTLPYGELATGNALEKLKDLSAIKMTFFDLKEEFERIKDVEIQLVSREALTERDIKTFHKISTNPDFKHYNVLRDYSLRDNLQGCTLIVVKKSGQAVAFIAFKKDENGLYVAWECCYPGQSGFGKPLKTLALAYGLDNGYKRAYLDLSGSRFGNRVAYVVNESMGFVKDIEHDAEYINFFHDVLDLKPEEIETYMDKFCSGDIKANQNGYDKWKRQVKRYRDLRRLIANKGLENLSFTHKKRKRCETEKDLLRKYSLGEIGLKGNFKDSEYLPYHMHLENLNEMAVRKAFERAKQSHNKNLAIRIQKLQMKPTHINATQLRGFIRSLEDSKRVGVITEFMEMLGQELG